MIRYPSLRWLVAVLLAAIGAFSLPLVFDQQPPQHTHHDGFNIQQPPARLTAIPFDTQVPKKSITPLIDDWPNSLIAGQR